MEGRGIHTLMGGKWCLSRIYHPVEDTPRRWMQMKGHEAELVRGYESLMCVGGLMQLPCLD